MVKTAGKHQEFSTSTKSWKGYHDMLDEWIPRQAECNSGFEIPGSLNRQPFS